MPECPLSGQSCSHKQNVDLPVIKHGEEAHVKVCAECPFHPSNVKDVLIPCNPMQLLEMAVQQQLVDANTIHCGACGLSMMELQATGKLGCEHCYQYFHDVLTELILPKAHGAVAHKGKTPKIGLKMDGMANIKTDKVDFADVIELLERKLNAAVAEERYENAAIVRDIIKQVKEKEAAK